MDHISRFISLFLIIEVKGLLDAFVHVFRSDIWTIKKTIRDKSNEDDGMDFDIEPVSDFKEMVREIRIDIDNITGMDDDE